MSLSRAEEALRLFAALQNKLETEAHQNEVSTASVYATTAKPLLRVSKSSASLSSSTELYTGGRMKTATATTTIAASTTLPQAAAASLLFSSSSVVTPSLPPPPPAAAAAVVSMRAGSASIEELKRKLEVADGIMTRLHRKNQQLVHQLSAVEREQRKVNATAASAEVVDLREKLRLREEEVMELKKRLRKAEETVERDSCSLMPIPHLVRRVQELDNQYREVLDIKIDAVLKETSVEKINAEIRRLFSHMKDKMRTDACHHETETRRLYESIAEVERQLAAAHASRKTYV